VDIIREESPMNPTPDVIGMVNARVVTMNRNRDVAQAVVIENDTIIHVGTTAEAEKLCTQKHGQILDMGGKTILPGLEDCHVHMMGTGLNASGVDLYDCTSIGEVLEKVNQEALRVGPEKWVFCNRIDESRLKEKRPPFAAELSKAAPENPVYVIDRGWHYTVVNDKAFGLMGLSPDIPGLRTGAAGEFIGRLQEEGLGISLEAFFGLLDDEDIERMLRVAAEKAARKGVTTLDAIEGGVLFSNAYIPAFRKAMDRMPVHVRLWWCTEDIDSIVAAGLPRQGKDIMLDGSIGSRTAAFSVPYTDAPEEKGILYYSDERVEQLIEAAHLKGIQIAFHAIGELAIKQALRGFERVLKRHPSGDHRHMIDHFGFVDHSAVEKAAELGVGISTQPSFMYLRGGPDSVYRIRLGEEREKRGYPLREFLDAGIVVSAGSDSDVTPIDPIMGIHAAVNQPYPESSVTVDEAVKMFTVDAAWSNREENRKGSIETGKIADLTVVSADPFEVPQDEIISIQVQLTMKGGVITYTA
jgi:predicted amidohydrolase YtcJ